MIRTNLNEEQSKRFWAKVELIPFHSCWEWTAAKTEKGYGVFGIAKETDKAHRISFKLSKGTIPMGQFVLHKCDNPGCVNPEHLFLGTNHYNVKDMIAKGRNSKPPAMAGHNRITLPENLIAMLGLVSDASIARQYGCSKKVIQRLRKERNLSPFPCQTRFKKKGG